MPDGLAARVTAHADRGEQAIGRAMEAALAARRLRDAAEEKDKELVHHLADASAAFASVRTAMTSYVPPPSVPTGAALPKRTPDSTRMIPALTMALGIGLAAWACAPYVTRSTTSSQSYWRTSMSADVSSRAGLAALRAGDNVTAEREFAEAGDDVRLGEALYNQKRYDEAKLIFEKHTGDGQARMFLGLIACKSGDYATAERLLTEAAQMGSRPADRLLKVKNWQEKI